MISWNDGTLVVPKLETSPIAVLTGITVVDEMVRGFGQEEGSEFLGSFALRFGDRYRAIPRADIWIYRPAGQRLSGGEIDKARLVDGYCS